MSDKLDLTVDEAVDAIARIYWQDIVQGVADRDIDKIYQAAISLKATESTRAQMKEKFENE
jgi:phenylalanine-4-hydroxylase